MVEEYSGAVHSTFRPNLFLKQVKNGGLRNSMHEGLWLKGLLRIQILQQFNQIFNLFCQYLSIF